MAEPKTFTERHPRLVAFLAAPASPRPLGALRIGLATILLGHALHLWPRLTELFGAAGLLDRELLDVVRGAWFDPAEPRLSWLTDALAGAGVEEALVLHGLFAVYVAALVGLLVGWRTRWMAGVAWGLQLLVLVGGQLAAYGAFLFAHIGLTYCLVMPVAGAWSLDLRAGRASGAPSAAARLSLSVLQVHLCVVYFQAGMLKLIGEQWRNGEAVWRVGMRPELAQFDFGWLADVPWLAVALCWATLVVELGYPLLVWPRRTRRLWAWATIGMHLAIAVGMGFWFFGLLMAAFTAAAFLVPAEPLQTAADPR